MPHAQGRSGQQILTDLCSFNMVQQSSDAYRLPHDCYMIYVGYLSEEYFNELVKQIQSQSDSNAHSIYQDDDSIKIKEYTMLETEDTECFLEHTVLNHMGAIDELNDDRAHRFVYEDHFNPALLQMMRERASFQRLKNICQFYEAQKKHVDIKKVMDEHERRTVKSASYFIKKGLSEDDAQGAALAVSFYTGTKSESVNRSTSLIARKANGEKIETATVEELNEASIILYYLVKALSYVPYYWGYVTRACQLTDDELKMYMPGSLITWIQFSSAKRGTEVAAQFDFSKRNTFFQIYSLTGRPIGQFSNFEYEDEVLFLPHSTFYVFKHEVVFHGTQHLIYMRQVELGLSQWSVLWVDDRIYNEKWENKNHMETAATRAMNLNVHFIPKSTTDAALSFLRSPFGQRLKNQDTFRIVTDMNRENEQPVHNAGARLIKALRKLGFKNECLVFTSDQRRAEQILQSELSSSEYRHVSVSDRAKDLRSFINFDKKPQLFQEPTYDDVDNGTMHNRKNTDLDILLRNCIDGNLSKERNNCVLLTTGSFNPVHPLHFQNLVRVKNYLENEHRPRMNVLAGYISPTHDSYVRHKLGDRAWIPSKDRCKLCEDAIQAEDSSISSWISVSRGESEYSEGFIDFPEVAVNFRDFINSKLVEQQRLLKYPIRVIYVCGLDHYNKCPDVEKMAKRTNMGSAVVYRTGYDSQKITNSYKTSDIIYVSSETRNSRLPDVSSTRIREYYQNPTATKSDIERYIYPHVHNYMSKKYKKK